MSRERPKLTVLLSVHG